MIRHLRYIILAMILLPLGVLSDETLVTVTQVINGKSFVLESGDIVRLAGIEAPNTKEEKPPYRDGEPLGEEAKKALENLILGKKIRIDSNKQPRDRHNRLLGQVFLHDGTWVQGAMLKAGYAMVYSFSDEPHALIMRMLTAEHEARSEKRGIWMQPYWRIIRPDEAAEFINRFKVTEGKVISVNDYHGNVYINFSERWKGNFAAFIPRKYMDNFKVLNPHSLVGKTIRLRGWINYHNAPMIDLTHPEQIKIE